MATKYLTVGRGGTEQPASEGTAVSGSAVRLSETGDATTAVENEKNEMMKQER